MKSPFYRYLYIKTDCISNTWPTKEVEGFVKSSNLFLQTGQGEYEYRRGFCTLSLLCVSDWDCWSDQDYNLEKTNYIDIVTSQSIEEELESFLKELPKWLGWRLTEEDESF